jgi:cytochrome c biogenesis protein CcdA
MEYYLEYIRHSFFTRLIGFVFAVGAIILAYGIYANIVTAPTYAYSGYINYGALGLLLIIGLIMMFGVKKILFFKVTSGFNNLSELSLKPNKYNELALRYLASKFF